jgi:H-NS histone family
MPEQTSDRTHGNDAELAQIIRELAAEQARRQAEKRQALKARIADMLNAEGMTLADLFPEELSHRRGKSTGTRHSAGTDLSEGAR